jgi:hypothetical protein
MWVKLFRIQSLGFESPGFVYTLFALSLDTLPYTSRLDDGQLSLANIDKNY